MLYFSHSQGNTPLETSKSPQSQTIFTSHSNSKFKIRFFGNKCFCPDYLHDRRAKPAPFPRLPPNPSADLGEGAEARRFRVKASPKYPVLGYLGEVGGGRVRAKSYFAYKNWAWVKNLESQFDSFRIFVQGRGRPEDRQSEVRRPIQAGWNRCVSRGRSDVCCEKSETTREILG